MNRNTEFGRRHHFENIQSLADYSAFVPPAEYEDFAGAIETVRRGGPFALASERPTLLEPTSGSTGTPKLIPVTSALRKEFAAAVQPWVAWLYLAHPRLLLGRHYWAISPNTPVPCQQGPSAVRVGFSDDADYLGAVGSLISRGILAVPGDMRHVVDPETFSLLTLLFLARNKNLALISVWHPSFLAVLLDALPRHLTSIISALSTGRLPGAETLAPELYSRLSRRFRRDVRRAAEIEAFDLRAHPEAVGRLWPKLRVISCWGGSRAEPWLERFKSLFPQAVIQEKGLLATEGCVTLPTGCDRLRPCAVRSHVLEFVDEESGDIHPLWNLREGRNYSVLLTTGGGLWRYRLHDQVRVVGFCHSTPSLVFMGKDNAVSDLVGEKLDERHAAEALHAVASSTGLQPLFAMILPPPSLRVGTSGYSLLLELSGADSDGDGRAAGWAGLVERELCQNYHYAHARRLGQLKPLQAVPVRNGLENYLRAKKAGGAREGTVKIPALDLSLSQHSCWWNAVR